MKKTFLLGITTLLILVTGCAQGPAEEKEPIRIGSILALTGETASRARPAKLALDMAINEINERGGIEGRPFEIIFEDGECDATKAVAAARKLIEFDEVNVIIGPVCSSASMAVAPIAEENSVIMLTPISSVPALKDAGDFIFRNRVSGGPHGKLMAETTYTDLGLKKAAILYINQDNGIGYTEAFTERYEELGGEILITEAYEKGDNDFRTQLAKIKALNPDSLFIAGQASENALKQARELGLNVQITGPITMQSPELVDIAGEAAEGAIYSYSAFDPHSEHSVVKTFRDKYVALHNEEPESFAANAYDAAMLLTTAIEQCELNTECIRDYLYAVKDYDGVSGKTTFDEFGEVSKPLLLKMVKGGEFVQYIKE